MTKENIERIKKFNEDRDWTKFHSPANLAKSLSIEAGELLECFQWDEEHFSIKDVKEELADILIYAHDLLSVLNLDEDQIVSEKIALNEEKYPIDKAKGSAKKYTEFDK